MTFFHSLNAAAGKVRSKALGVYRGGVRGRQRTYHSISEDKVNKMMQLKYQQRTEAKIKWALNCYNDWREMRMAQPSCDAEIFLANINEDFSKLEKNHLEFALCRFICEVRKSKEDGDFPGRSLYQMVCALQSHLKKNGITWKLVHGEDFQKFNRVLDTVMQERAALAIGTVKRQAQVISLEYENHLWVNNVLGEDTPDKLRSTVLYLIGVNCALRAGDEHYALRRPGGCTSSQINFDMTCGLKCVVYKEDCVTKTNRGGLRDMKKDRKVVWIKPNDSPMRCPVRLIEKYISLLPVGGCKPNFYLQSLRKPKPNQWYSTIPVGINTLRKTVGSMLRDAGLDGYFTNHSLRRTCATRLFQAGKSTKLIKEITGHVSDAVEKYQVTSNDQKLEASSIIQGEIVPIKLSQSEPMMVVDVPQSVSNEQKFKMEKLDLAKLVKSDVKEKTGGTVNTVTNVVESAIQAVGNRRAKLTIHVELLD